MRIGVPREIKDGERRVALLPIGVQALVSNGHELIVEAGAGTAAGFDDAQYRAAGATVANAVGGAWDVALVLKVKELQQAEYPHLRAGLTVFGFAHLNRDRALLEVVLAAGVRVIAYENVGDGGGGLPLLAPMSRIAGRLAPFAAAQAIGNDHGGSGVLLTGVDAVPPARIVVVGAGNVGGEAARVSARFGCDVTVFSRGAPRRERLANALAVEGTPVRVCAIDDTEAFGAALRDTDVIIAGVLEPGTLSPKLITRAMLRDMRPGSVLVDVGIDQGGIAETSRQTKLSSPTYVECGVVHYCVPNMPALVARTATLALTGATLPYVLRLATLGIDRALAEDAGLAAGLMVSDGSIVHAGLARDARHGAAAASRD